MEFILLYMMSVDQCNPVWHYDLTSYAHTCMHHPIKHAYTHIHVQPYIPRMYMTKKHAEHNHANITHTYPPLFSNIALVRSSHILRFLCFHIQLSFRSVSHPRPSLDPWTHLLCLVPWARIQARHQHNCTVRCLHCLCHSEYVYYMSIYWVQFGAVWYVIRFRLIQSPNMIRYLLWNDVYVYVCDVTCVCGWMSGSHAFLRSDSLCWKQNPSSLVSCRLGAFNPSRRQTLVSRSVGMTCAP